MVAPASGIGGQLAFRFGLIDKSEGVRRSGEGVAKKPQNRSLE